MEVESRVSDDRRICITGILTLVTAFSGTFDRMRQLETSDFLHMHGQHCWWFKRVQKSGRLPSFQVILTKVQYADSLHNRRIIRAVNPGDYAPSPPPSLLPGHRLPHRSASLAASSTSLRYCLAAALPPSPVLTITLHTVHR